MRRARIKVEILTEVYATRDYRLYRKVQDCRSEAYEGEPLSEKADT